MTAKSRFVWIKLRECMKLLYEKTFAARMKGIVYKIYAKPSLLYLSEAWRLKTLKFCGQGGPQ